VQIKFHFKEQNKPKSSNVFKNMQKVAVAMLELKLSE